MIIKFIIALALLQSPTNPIRVHCSLEEDEKNLIVDCRTNNGDKNDGEVYEMPAVALRKFAPVINELQPGVSTFELSDDGKQVCLVAVNVHGGFAKESANRKPECVSRLPENKKR